MQSPDLRTDLGPNVTPSPALLETVAQDARRRRHHVDGTVPQLARRHLLPDDLQKVKSCRRPLLRLAHPDAQGHRLRAMGCQSMWCPWCIRTMHRQRANFQADRLRSLHPKRDLALRNLVFTLPPNLAQFISADPKRLLDFKEAATRTIARALDYETPRNAMRELGLIINVHPYGDRDPHWPGFAPHLDVLLAGTKISNGEVRAMRPSWQLYEHTRAIYRDELTRCFAKLLPSGEKNPILVAGIDAHARPLTTRGIDVPNAVVYVGKQVTGDQAMHRVWYSSRPLFDMGRARLEQRNGRDVVVYTPQGGNLHHRVDARTAFARLYRLRPFLDGSEVHSMHGTLSRRSYAQACQLIGNAPVPVKRPTGWKRVEAYYPDKNGHYDPEQNKRIRPRRAHAA